MKVYFFPDIDKKIRSLRRKESARTVKVIELFEKHGFDLTEKHLKKLTEGLWELRAGRWRLLFGRKKNRILIVSIFLKRTQTTPKKEIDKALKRLKVLK